MKMYRDRPRGPSSRRSTRALPKPLFDVPRKCEECIVNHRLILGRRLIKCHVQLLCANLDIQFIVSIMSDNRKIQTKLLVGTCQFLAVLSTNFALCPQIRLISCTPLLRFHIK